MVSPENKPDKQPAGLRDKALPAVHRAAKLAPGHIITLDGPSGAGKSVIAKQLAAHYEVPYLESGALYRTVALIAQRTKTTSVPGLVQIAENLSIEFRLERLESGRLVNRVISRGEDLTEVLRAQNVSDAASHIAKIAEVRAALIPLQLRLGRGGCVAEGRDMGSVIFPQAEHKYFLTATLEDRAVRRLREELGLGNNAEIPDKVRRERLPYWLVTMRERDARDTGRADSPLKRAEDSTEINSTGCALEDVVLELIERIDLKEKKLATDDYSLLE